MSVGITEDIVKYLALEEVEVKLLVTIELDSENIYRFIADESYEEIEICGNTYYSAPIIRGVREENTDNSIDSISLTLSNCWKEWAGIVANHGNDFLGKPCILSEWFPEFPEREPVIMYRGILDDIKMTPTEFNMTVVRILGDYDQQAPIMTFDVNCQWLFKDARCQYKGDAYYNCGKTLADCIQRKNVLNFGGFPSVPKEFLIKS